MPWQFGFELTEILLGKRKADGWMGGWVGWLVLAKKAKKEIEKYGRIWQEHFLLLTLILCDFIYIYKG